VRTKQGQWIKVPTVPGAFLINTGEMLARWSNGRFAPTPHRVINATPNVRHSIPFFFGPHLDHVITAAPTCVGPDNPPRYEPMSYGQHRLALGKRNFAHRADPAEVQSEGY